jgi:hemoglobin/transferrin/lactoferrin receptor protein
MDLFGQNIQVLDIESEFPIDRVLIYNNTKTIHMYTDKNGKADISTFSNNEKIFFQHLAFSNLSMTKTEISSSNGLVFLENKSEQIAEVILSASRNKEKRTRIAEHIEVISKHEIVLKSPQTSADLLALTPGVKVQKSQSGGGSPVLRGMESNRVLLVVDGVRMNNAIYRKGHLQNSITVSPNLLARTEVLFGPSSIIYGSDALGGVIHYYTKKPLLNDKNLYNSSLLTRYSNVNNELSASYTGEFSSKKWASLTGISVNQFRDLKMGKIRKHGFNNWGLVPFYSSNTLTHFEENPIPNTDTSIQKNTGYKQIDLLQKFLIPIDLKTELCFNFQFSNSTNIPRFDKLNEYIDGRLRYAEWYYGPQKRFLASSQLSFNPNLKWLNEGKITLAYQDIYESRNNRNFDSLDKNYRNENVKVASLNGDFHVPLTKDNKRILSYGFETSYNNVTSQAKGFRLKTVGNQVLGFFDDFTIQSRYPDGGSSYTNFALYSNYRLDHNKKGTLNIGIRYTYTLLKAKWIDETFIQLPDMDVSLNNSAFSGTLGYAYKPTKNWQLNAVLSSGFRSPNIDDVGKIREKKGRVTVPNTNLKPEYAYNTEFGILNLSNTKKTMIGFNAFYMLLTNYITRDYYTLNNKEEILYDGTLAKIQANINKGNAFVIGSTLSFKSKISEHIKLDASTTYTQGQTYDTEEPMSSIPPLFGNAGILYNFKKWNIGLSYRFNARKHPKDYNLTEGIDNLDESPLINSQAVNDIDSYFGTPAWQTFNLSTDYKLSKGTTLQVHIDNILDQHYKEFASGVSAPGRNISIALNAHF